MARSFGFVALLVLLLTLTCTAAFAAPIPATQLADRLFHEEATLVKNTYFCGGAESCEAVFAIEVSRSFTPNPSNIDLSLEDTNGKTIAPTGMSLSYDIGRYECAGGCDETLLEETGTRTDTLTIPCGNATDLAIVDIIPIQVIPNVNMIQGKSGYIAVNVTNKGTISVQAYVRAWAGGTELSLSLNDFDGNNANNRTIDPNDSLWYIFDTSFDSEGAELIINASVEVAE